MIPEHFVPHLIPYTLPLWHQSHLVSVQHTAVCPSFQLSPPWGCWWHQLGSGPWQGNDVLRHEAGGIWPLWSSLHCYFQQNCWFFMDVLMEFLLELINWGNISTLRETSSPCNKLRTQAVSAGLTIVKNPRPNRNSQVGRVEDAFQLHSSLLISAVGWQDHCLWPAPRVSPLGSTEQRGRWDMKHHSPKHRRLPPGNPSAGARQQHH